MITCRHPFLSLLVATTLSAPTPPAWAQGTEDTVSSRTDILGADGLTREQMAAAVLRALEAIDFTPPGCVPGQEMFDDVPASSLFCAWIEELARRGITGGCGGDNYCPSAPVSRAEMAVFLVKTQFPSRVPAGVTVTGWWGFWINTNGTRDSSVSISYPAPMSGALGFQYIEAGDGPTVHCPGSDDLPAAAPGWSCLYEELSNLAVLSSARLSPFGITVRFAPTGSGDMSAHGTWAATAPID